MKMGIFFLFILSFSLSRLSPKQHFYFLFCWEWPRPKQKKNMKGRCNGNGLKKMNLKKFWNENLSFHWCCLFKYGIYGYSIFFRRFFFVLGYRIIIIIIIFIIKFSQFNTYIARWMIWNHVWCLCTVLIYLWISL